VRACVRVRVCVSHAFYLLYYYINSLT